MNKQIVLILTLIISALPAASQELFVVDDGNARLYKAFASTGDIEILKSTIGRVGGMAVNNISDGVSDIYYTIGTNSPSGNIVRVNRDGSNQTTIASSLSFPTGLAFDSTSNNLFFVQTQMGIPTIYKVDASGSGSAVFVTAGTLSTGPIDLAIDEPNQKVYWTDSRNNSIRRANFDGSSEEIVCDALPGNLSGIVVEPLLGRVYWLESSIQQIRYVSTSAALPATPITAVSSALIGIGGIDHDTSTSPTTLYFTSQSSVLAKAQIDGSAVQIAGLADGVSAPKDVVVSYSSNSGGPTPVPTATPVDSVLVPGTQLTAPPAVSVNNKTISLTLQNFSTAQKTSASIVRKFLASAKKAAGNQKLTVRYDVRVNAAKKADSKKILSKKNILTVKNLKPGNYTVNYSVIAYARKSKSQIDKAKAAGKNGFTDLNKKVFLTNFSPSAEFTIN